MRKVILYVAQSVDGFIADHNGSVEFLSNDHPDAGSADYDEFIKDCDVAIMGKVTYNQIKDELSPEYWPYQDLTTYVFSNDEIEEYENVETVNGDPADLIKKIKSEEGKNIFLVGGANIIQQFIEKGLVDEIQLFISPIILGRGVRLFDNFNKLQTKLEFKGQSILGKDLVKLTYVKK